MSELTLWEQRSALRDELHAAGARFRLNGGHLSYLVEDGTPEWVLPTIEREYQALEESHRHRAGLCIGCGTAKAMRPFLGQGVEETPARRRDRPKLWCDTCFGEPATDWILKRLGATRARPEFETITQPKAKPRRALVSTSLQLDEEDEAA